MARPSAEAGPIMAAPTNALVASAVRYPKNAARIYHKTGESWQRECYRHYAICGEARFAARFFGNAMSRARLYVDQPGNGRGEVHSGPAYDLLKQLFSGSQGQPQMLSAIGEHLTIAGECFLIGRSVKTLGEEEAEGDVWEVVSPLEVSVSRDIWSIDLGDDRGKVRLSDDDVVIRIWNPMPGNRMEADSPFRSLLPILSEIEWLTRHVFRQVSSRLAGAGILFLPNSMTFPDPPAQEGEQVDLANQADAMMHTLASAMMESIEDPSSPASTVPLIVTAEGEDIDKAKLLTFWSDLDANALELRSEAIRRFALGMDLPPEQVLGMSSNSGTGGGTSNGVSHWGAWQIEESTIKMHIEPMLETVVNALTVAYLRPLLEEDTDEYVAFDSSALRLRPDRSQEALELYDRGLIKAEIVLQENGFDPNTEAMGDAELKTWLLRKIASGSATPEQVQAALGALGVILNTPELPESDQQTRETPEPPSLEEHPSNPRTPGDLALLAACDGLVWRALEKAGNRHLNAGLRGKDRDRTIEPTEFHLRDSVNGQGPTLLDGAFNYAPRVLDGLCDEPEKVTQLLENYCLALFETQAPHSRWRLAEYLRKLR